ncbi:MAG TPA: hypothetical protein PLJ08_09925, partial [Cyclobacteriaceae bacterium]|nr:hypothetical protein [Cyclobacteriaceae bacterium]
LTWSDQAATAADVTILQVFRDLFSSEVLRAGEEISVGSMTLMFTDLRNSTKLYRDIGDAPAYGRVREHFEVLEGLQPGDRVITSSYENFGNNEVLILN